MLTYTDIAISNIFLTESPDLCIRIYGDLHSEISGNKSFKLSRFIKESKPEEALVSFGGAWSNHLLALSAAAKKINRKTVGIIRGEEPSNYSPYLKAMQGNGMHLHFISREDFKEKESPQFIATIREIFGPCYIIPEGGAGEKGVLGASAMVHENEDYDLVFLPGATGTTLAGVASKLRGFSTSVGCVQVLKGSNILRNELLRTAGLDIQSFKNVEIFEDFHFGGYAKKTKELEDFQSKWFEKTGIPLDLVYGAKAMFGLLNLIKSGKYSEAKKILYLHTGGLGPSI